MASSVYSTIEQVDTFMGGANSSVEGTVASNAVAGNNNAVDGNGNTIDGNANIVTNAPVTNSINDNMLENDVVVEKPKFNYRNLFIFIALVAAAFMAVKSSSDKQFVKASSLLVISVGLVGFFFYMSYYQYRCVKYDQYLVDGKRYDDSVKLYLNNDLAVLDMKTIGVGLVAGVVFGFIDNAGLFFGMDSLEPYFPKDSTPVPEGECSDDKVIAGWGNTFSDALGSFLSVFIANIISNMTKINQTPIWTESIGIVIGCILGIYIPKAIVDKKIKQSNIE